jgi:tripartite-type tricarboxylate transporter receptor subunit TctC
MRKCIAGFAMLLALAGGSASAQNVDQVRANLAKLKPADFPTQPIEFVVMFPAGGGMDNISRLLGKYFEKYTGQRVVNVNRVGGAGVVGHTYLAMQAKPDGYTVGIVEANTVLDGVRLQEGKSAWQHGDLEPVAFVNTDATTWIVSTEGNLKNKTMAEVIAEMKAKPGTVRVAAVTNTMVEYLAEQVESEGGVKSIKVPFQGGGPALTALLGGHIDVSGNYLAEYRGQLEAGKVKVLAVAGDDRMPALANVPTFNEALGTSKINWSPFRYAAVPKNVPAARKRYIEAALDAALRDPELLAEFAKSGLDGRRKYATSAQVAAEVDRVAKARVEFFSKRAGK